MRVFVCGDIHSTFDINKLDSFMDREELDKERYLVNAKEILFPAIYCWFEFL
jgi:hypothetical protein